MNCLQNKFVTLSFFFFCFLLSALNVNQCHGIVADAAPAFINESQKSASPLHREWTSKNGKHKQTGLLTSVTKTNCQISIGNTSKSIPHGELSNHDQFFLAAMEFVNLENLAQAREGLFRISEKFHYPSAVQQLVGRPIEVTTLAGVTYSCSDLLELNPRRARFQDGKAQSRSVDLCDFDSPSKFTLLYNRIWEAEYNRDFKKLAKVAKRAKRNYTFAWQNGLATSSYFFPTGKSTTSKESWGLEWSPPCLSHGTIIANGFSADWSDNYFGGWEKHNYKSAKREIAESKARDRKLAAKTLQLKKRAYLANHRSYWNYQSATQYKSSGRVSVRGYYRRDGTYVRPHTRRYPR